MDTKDPIMLKLFDRFYGQKYSEELEQAKQKIKEQAKEEANKEVIQVQRRLQEMEAARREAQMEAARREAQMEAARREAEIEAARQWQELMLKLLEYRFQSVPVTLIMLLQHVPFSQRSQVSDLILDTPDATACLQAMRQLLVDKNLPDKNLVDKK